MKLLTRTSARSISAAVCFAALLNATALAQQPQEPQSDSVLRVKTELVQTALTVVDKDGRFVPGLNRDQFELVVDGKPRPINFFEQVTSGSTREQQLSAVGKTRDPEAKPANAVVQGRRIVFFIDDLHLSPDSMDRTRQMLKKFLDDELTSKDTVAIVSASGQVGFLQQFTNNKLVLEAARDRLSPRPYDVQGFGTGSTRMTEYLALNIDNERSDKRIFGFYVAECMKQNMPPRRNNPAYNTMVKALQATCETDVKSSARAILIQAAHITQNMYASLESIMRSSARLPGRKLAFFVSDGFLMDPGAHGAGLRDKLDRIIDAATRAGVVIYTIDARGLSTSSVVDVTNSRPQTGSADPSVLTAQTGEIAATQDALNALAGDTGGRALRNTNYFDRWVEKVLDETSNYYLLAWRPETDEEKLPKFRQVQIRIIGHPELTARTPKGYVTGPQPVETAATTIPKQPANHVAKVEDAEIRDALADYYPSATLPTLLSLTYLNTPKNETVLTSSIQIAANRLAFGSDGQQPASLRIAGVVLNDKGKIASSFKNQLSVKPLSGKSDNGSVLYNEPTPLAPGIYQVRVAARDEKSGRIGSAMEWAVIPDLTTKRLTLSSLLLGGQVLENGANQDGNAQVQLSIDHRFARSSHLPYWVFVYNAKRDAAGNPNLTVKSEIKRDGQLIVAAPPRTIKSGSPDPDRIPFGQDLSLKNFSPGRYELRVTIVDVLANTTAVQSIEFEVF